MKSVILYITVFALPFSAFASRVPSYSGEEHPVHVVSLDHNWHHRTRALSEYSPYRSSEAFHLEGYDDAPRLLGDEFDPSTSLDPQFFEQGYPTTHKYGPTFTNFPARNGLIIETQSAAFSHSSALQPRPDHVKYEYLLTSSPLIDFMVYQGARKTHSDSQVFWRPQEDTSGLSKS
ncbi:hypothetical protein NLI96_g8084 [Meripilus lineatus]|uniref:Uncharacterized protein n=1 Tax=Meripilus lineatus TaxID=2056292 RepID=A0AAD5UY59_9APHY|nr:hypothetical protein NLI96_g8084 [Physisporinus lineatus]